MQSKNFISEFFRSFSRLFDVLFSLLIVVPLVVIYWQTAWKISDILFTPEEPLKSATISFVIGFFGQFVLLYYQDLITRCLKFDNCRCINLVFSKVYALFAAQTCIQFWRGIWMFIDALSSGNEIVMVVNLVQNSLILILLKTFKNSLSSPFVMLIDKSDGNYPAGTLFSSKVDRHVESKNFAAYD
jgi:hypothetical protein